jgi:hypothetical protein
MSGATFDRAQHEWKQAASVEAELLKRVEAAEAERNRLRAEIDLCLTEQEADRACCMLQQLLAANMGFVLGKDLTMESAEVVPPAGSMMN